MVEIFQIVFTNALLFLTQSESHSFPHYELNTAHLMAAGQCGCTRSGDKRAKH